MHIDWFGPHCRQLVEPHFSLVLPIRPISLRLQVDSVCVCLVVHVPTRSNEPFSAGEKLIAETKLGDLFADEIAHERYLYLCRQTLRIVSSPANFSMFHSLVELVLIKSVPPLAAKPIQVHMTLLIL